MSIVQVATAKRKKNGMVLSPRRPNHPFSRALSRQAAPEQSCRPPRRLQVFLLLYGFLCMGVNIAGARAETTEQRKQFDQAYADFKLGNYATALSEFEILAEAGNVAAQYNLGFMRVKGLGGAGRPRCGLRLVYPRGEGWTRARATFFERTYIGDERQADLRRRATPARTSKKISGLIEPPSWKHRLAQRSETKGRALTAAKFFSRPHPLRTASRNRLHDNLERVTSVILRPRMRNAAPTRLSRRCSARTRRLSK